jgi:hypothetical protein
MRIPCSCAFSVCHLPHVCWVTLHYTVSPQTWPHLTLHHSPPAPLSLVMYFQVFDHPLIFGCLHGMQPLMRMLRLLPHACSAGPRSLSLTHPAALMCLAPLRVPLCLAAVPQMGQPTMPLSHSCAVLRWVFAVVCATVWPYGCTEPTSGQTQLDP